MDKKTERAIETEGNNQKSVESDTESVGENTKTSEKVTGGSVEVKADQITYKSYIPEDIANKVSEVFNKAISLLLSHLMQGLILKLLPLTLWTAMKYQMILKEWQLVLLGKLD